MRTVLAAAWLILGTDATDRHHRVLPPPAGKGLAIEITIGAVRIEGWDRGDAEIDLARHAPSAAQLDRLPIAIEDTPSRVIVRAVRAGGATDPAFRSDVVTGTIEIRSR